MAKRPKLMDESTAYAQHLEGCFAPKIPGGATEKEFQARLAKLAPALKALQQSPDRKTQAIFRSVTGTDDLKDIERIASRIRAEASDLLVIGAGGSTLSGRMLHLLSPSPKPRLYFIDNIDPAQVTRLLESLDFSSTHVLAISKSGDTAETIGLLLVLLAHAKKFGAEIPRQFTGISVQGAGALRGIAAQYGFEMLDHDPELGGRFSAFSSVGLIPASVCGMDIRRFRAGAAGVLEALHSAGAPEAVEAARGAAMHHTLAEKGFHLSVMMPYSEQLAGLSWWYRQSWAESLGKDGKGTTPLYGIGAPDQHSQLQLYLSGPRDKQITLVMTHAAGSGPRIELPEHAPESVSYLKGRTLGDVLAAMQRATGETLVKHGCPVRSFYIREANEYAMGALLAHFTLEIMFTAHLLGVNPFDQPAVEESKHLTRAYLRSDQ